MDIYAELNEIKNIIEEEMSQPEEVEVKEVSEPSEPEVVKETRRGWRPASVVQIEDMLAKQNKDREFLANAKPQAKQRYLSDKAKASGSNDDWAQVIKNINLAGGQ